VGEKKKVEDIRTAFMFSPPLRGNEQEFAGKEM